MRTAFVKDQTNMRQQRVLFFYRDKRDLLKIHSISIRKSSTPFRVARESVKRTLKKSFDRTEILPFFKTARIAYETNFILLHFIKV
jgi:hypothetical protein